ncbi:MAG: DUF5615 family PIN-like protein, partial [Candidatus Hydrogenedentes bacterium]|nr:DUF5615 family PIN-like protein [Candidatus Hydrogenedentota bacterium]
MDNALSPIVAQRLCENGHDAVHVRDISMGSAEDAAIFDKAAQGDRIILSADTDFATLLAVRGEAQPSVILFRRGVDRRPFQQVNLLLANLDAIEGPLETGCV